MYNMNPEADIGFLVHDVSRLMRAWFDARARELGLTRAQWRVLAHLGPRQGLNQRTLAEILELDNVTLGRHIDRLERDGWLERRPDPADRRAWRLYLSETARPTLEKMGELAVQTHEAALAGLTPDELQRFVDVLIRIKGNLAPAEENDEVPARTAGAAR